MHNPVVRARYAGYSHVAVAQRPVETSKRAGSVQLAVVQLPVWGSGNAGRTHVLDGEAVESVVDDSESTLEVSEV